MNPVEEVAFEIEKNKADILLLFEQRLKEKIELPNELKESCLTELIPKQIDLLIQSLIRNSQKAKLADSIVIERPKLKALNKVFSLDILISQFIILKDVILEILEKKGPVEKTASNIIWQYIVSSIKIAVTEFERLSDEQSEDMKLQLNQSTMINQKIQEQIASSRENEERYKTLVQGVEDYAVYTTDNDGLITSWNMGAIRMKGYLPDEVIGKHFSMLYPDEAQLKDEPENHLHHALLEGRFRGEGMRKRKNGEVFLADVYIRPIYQDGKLLGYAKIVADMTERNRLIQSANISKAQIVDLKSEKKMIQSFISTLSHDLRGPLMVARAASEILKRKFGLDEKEVVYLDKIISNIDRTSKMVTDLLDANKLKAGHDMTLKIHSWDMVRIIKNVCEDFHTLGVRIDFHCDKREVKGHWDGEGVRRIMENLIGNAMKYGDKNSPVDVSLIDLNENVCLKVHNMGNPIIPEEQVTMFDQFTRTKSARKERSGWGIGLSLVKGVTEAHGGTVEVESFPVDGTTFIVNLPKEADQHKNL